MNKVKTQTRRIIETYITVVVLVTAATLILSGISISKINTDYMETGIRTGKIVAERANTEISIITHDGIKIEPEYYFITLQKILAFIPPPINTLQLLLVEIIKL